MQNRITKAIKNNKYYQQVQAEYRELAQKQTQNQPKSQQPQKQTYLYFHPLPNTQRREYQPVHDNFEEEDMMGLRKQMQFMCFDISGIKKERGFQFTSLGGENGDLRSLNQFQHRGQYCSTNLKPPQSN